MKKLAVLILLLGFVAKSPAFSAVFAAKAVPSCEEVTNQAAAGHEDGQNDSSGGSPMNDTGDETDDVKFPMQPAHLTPVFYPVTVLPACIYRAASVPQLPYAVNTPPPRF